MNKICARIRSHERRHAASANRGIACIALLAHHSASFALRGVFIHRQPYASHEGLVVIGLFRVGQSVCVYSRLADAIWTGSIFPDGTPAPIEGCQ